MDKHSWTSNRTRSCPATDTVDASPRRPGPAHRAIRHSCGLRLARTATPHAAGQAGRSDATTRLTLNRTAPRPFLAPIASRAIARARRETPTVSRHSRNAQRARPFARAGKRGTQHNRATEPHPSAPSPPPATLDRPGHMRHPGFPISPGKRLRRPCAAPTRATPHVTTYVRALRPTRALAHSRARKHDVETTRFEPAACAVNRTRQTRSRESPRTLPDGRTGPCRLGRVWLPPLRAAIHSPDRHAA